jgi:hypothetical protein
MNRIWIYQSKRALTGKEQEEISYALTGYVNRWAAHNAKLDARFEILHSHFIILSVNQEEVTASGCSIDDSVRFMQEIDKTFNLSLFDRQQMAYVDSQGEVKVCRLNDIGDLRKNGAIQDNSYIFNNLILDEAEMESSWKIPFKDSGFVAFA